MQLSKYLLYLLVVLTFSCKQERTDADIEKILGYSKSELVKLYTQRLLEDRAESKILELLTINDSDPKEYVDCFIDATFTYLKSVNPSELQKGEVANTIKNSKELCLNQLTPTDEAKINSTVPNQSNNSQVSITLRSFYNAIESKNQKALKSFFNNKVTLDYVKPILIDSKTVINDLLSDKPQKMSFNILTSNSATTIKNGEMTKVLSGSIVRHLEVNGNPIKDTVDTEIHLEDSKIILFKEKIRYGQ